MRQSAWTDKQQREAAQQQKIRWEFLALILVCTTLAGGFFLFKPAGKQLSEGKPPVSTLDQMLQHSQHASSIARKVPANYQTQGTVDDRYTLARDPDSGEFILNDAMGGIGTNNTSIDGVRAKLAKEMVELEQYTDLNRGKLSPAAYEWLKKVTRAGMKLAFGTPGIPAYAQPGIKKELLAELHHISTNPEQSVMRTSKYLELEKVLQSPESAYIAEKDINQSNFFRYDPLSAPLLPKTAILQDDPLVNLLATTNLYPSIDKLTISGSPYAYTVYDTPVLTASTTTTKITGTSSTSTSSDTTMSPNYTPSGITTLNTTTLSTTIGPTYTSLTTNIDPKLSTTMIPSDTSPTNTMSTTPSTSTSPTTTKLKTPTVTEYYDSIFNPRTSSPTTTRRTSTTSP